MGSEQVLGGIEVVLALSVVVNYFLGYRLPFQSFCLYYGNSSPVSTLNLHTLSTFPLTQSDLVSYHLERI